MDDTREVTDALRARFPNVQLPRKDDICYATQNRQNAVKELVGEAELVLVVGAPESSNSNRLVEIARKAGRGGAPRADRRRHRPGLARGRRLRRRHRGRVGAGGAGRARWSSACARSPAARPASSAMPQIDEGVVFQLPSELREEAGRQAR